MNSTEQSIAQGIEADKLWKESLKNWILKGDYKIDIPNPADKGCIIYVDNYGNEISRDYLRPKLLES